MTSTRRFSFSAAPRFCRAGEGACLQSVPVLSPPLELGFPMGSCSPGWRQTGRQERHLCGAVSQGEVLGQRGGLHSPSWAGSHPGAGRPCRHALAWGEGPRPRFSIGGRPPHNSPTPLSRCRREVSVSGRQAGVAGGHCTLCTWGGSLSPGEGLGGTQASTTAPVRGIWMMQTHDCLHPFPSDKAAPAELLSERSSAKAKWEERIMRSQSHPLKPP